MPGYIKLAFAPRSAKGTLIVFWVFLPFEYIYNDIWNRRVSNVPLEVRDWLVERARRWVGQMGSKVGYLFKGLVCRGARLRGMQFYKNRPYIDDDKHAPMYRQELLVDRFFVVGFNTNIASTKWRYVAWSMGTWPNYLFENAVEGWEDKMTMKTWTLWHQRYGHLNYLDLLLLQKREW